MCNIKPFLLYLSRWWYTSIFFSPSHQTNLNISSRDSFPVAFMTIFFSTFTVKCIQPSVIFFHISIPVDDDVLYLPVLGLIIIITSVYSSHLSWSGISILFRWSFLSSLHFTTTYNFYSVAWRVLFLSSSSSSWLPSSSSISSSYLLEFNEDMIKVMSPPKEHTISIEGITQPVRATSYILTEKYSQK